MARSACSPARVPRLDRVDLLAQELAAAHRLVARFGERDRVERSQAHGSRPAGQHEAKQPALAAPIAHLQVQATAVRMQA